MTMLSVAHIARRPIGIASIVRQLAAKRAFTTALVAHRYEILEPERRGKKSYNPSVGARGAAPGAYGAKKAGKGFKGRNRIDELLEDDDDDMAPPPPPPRRGKGAPPQRPLNPTDWSRKAPAAPNSSAATASKPNPAVAKTKPIQPAALKRRESPRKVSIPLPPIITVSDLAKAMDVKMRRVQYVMSQSGHTDTRPDMMLSFGEAELVAMEFNMNAVPLSTSATDFDVFPRPPPSNLQELPLRAPVVAIMGHVDHGKTTLLDKLRSASVAAGEAGGITQHVGAFSVEVKGMSTDTERKAITFLDTPGHAAFTQMRSRGAKVTDIVVLVVAADDGVMPQTKEVLSMVREVQEEEGARNMGGGGLQLLVAISKIDRADADIQRVKQQLLQENVLLEDFGGDVPCVGISGRTGEGLDALQDNLVVISELNELRAERDGPMEGYVIESRVDKGLGNTAIVLVKRGTLAVGEYVVAGTHWCKVRRLADSSGTLEVRNATPGEALMVTGWRDLPMAGDTVLGVRDSPDGQDAETLAKKCIDTRKRVEEQRRLMRDAEAINIGRREDQAERDKVVARKREVRRLRQLAKLRGERYDDSMMEGYDRRMKEQAQARESGDVDATKLELRLIIKGDVSGTVEAVEGAIANIGNSEVGVKVVSKGVGEVSDGDLDMAIATKSQILAFSVNVPRAIQTAAQGHVPQIKIYSDDVIYRLMTYVTEQCAALLPPTQEIRIDGEAVVQQVFSIKVTSSVSRNIAGCRVTNGTISKKQLVRVLRNAQDSARKADEKEETGLTRGRDDQEAVKLDSNGRQIIYEGRLESLKQVKKEVEEMRRGTECGMAFEDNFQDLREGDLVQSYRIDEVPRSL